MTGTLRAPLRWLRHLPDRLAHPLRQRSASRRVTASRPVRSILFLCNGNICRSPYAAAAFAARWDGPSPPQVVSAGLIGPGRACPPNAIAVASARGVSLEAHRSQLVDAGMLREADLVVLVDPHHRRRLSQHVPGLARPTLVLGDLDPAPIARRTIADPIDQDERMFERVYERIDRCLITLADAVGRRNGRR